MLKTQCDKPIEPLKAQGQQQAGCAAAGTCFHRAPFPCRSVNACATPIPRVCSNTAGAYIQHPRSVFAARGCFTQPHTVSSRPFAVAACQHRALCPTTRLLLPLRVSARLRRARRVVCSRFLWLRAVVWQQAAPLDTIRNNSNISSRL